MFARVRNRIRLNNIPLNNNNSRRLPVTAAGVVSFERESSQSKTVMIAHKSPLFLFQQKRMLSVWTIPKLLLASNKNKKYRRLMLVAAGGVTLLSSVFGPMVWITVGGIASVVSWRVIKKTTQWWEHLSPNSSSSSGLTQSVLSRVGAHRGAECVRQLAIERLQKFKTTEAGKQIFKEFGLMDHEKELFWDDIHKSESLRLDNGSHKVSVVFWLEDQVSTTPKGGSCEVNAEAVVDNKGKIDLTQIRLSSPDWHKDELVPIG